MAAVSACRAGLDKDIKEVFEVLQGRRKEEFLAFGEHSILPDGGLPFSDFAQIMKGGFWLHLEEFLKYSLIIIEKKILQSATCSSIQAKNAIKTSF